jgi:hypothetical protein
VELRIAMSSTGSENRRMVNEYFSNIIRKITVLYIVIHQLQIETDFQQSIQARAKPELGGQAVLEMGRATGEYKI